MVTKTVPSELLRQLSNTAKVEADLAERLLELERARLSILREDAANSVTKDKIFQKIRVAVGAEDDADIQVNLQAGIAMIGEPGVAPSPTTDGGVG